MDRRRTLKAFREKALREEAKRLSELSGAETLEQGLDFMQFALEVGQSGARKNRC